MIWNVATALYFAKQLHIDHGNIKPSHILVAYDGSYKVRGLGSDLFSYLTRTHTLSGSLIFTLFMSPQQRASYCNLCITGEYQAEYDSFKTDVYVLGMIVLFIAGCECIRCRTKEHTQRVVMELGSSEWLKQLLLGMLQEEEGNRCDIEHVLYYISAVAVGSDPSHQAAQTTHPVQTTSLDYCAFCNAPLDAATTRYHFQMTCRHVTCTKLCHDNYTNLGHTCPLCQAPRAQ